MSNGGVGRDADVPRYCVIDCEDAPKWDGHENYWLDGLRRPGERWDVFRAWNGELPESTRAYQGCVLTGAKYSVNDDLPWLPPLFEYVARCVGDPKGTRVFGACFGLQVVTRALGGRVGRNPSGRFVFGTETIELDEQFLGSWFGQMGKRELTLLVSHGEQALELPSGAERLARSQTSLYEIYCVQDRALTVQFHCELTREALIANILPALRENQRLNDEEERAALASLEKPVDSHLLMNAVRRFLEGPAADVRPLSAASSVG